MVKRILTVFLIFSGIFIACNQPEGFKKPEDALDAGREFVRAVLDGNFSKAEMYVLPEEDDLMLFNRYKDYVKKRSEKERLNLKSSSIQINKVEEQNDSTTIINYANSYSKEPVDIKVIKKNGEWWVDFSYTFAGKELDEMK
jgi:Domain of unknown function (DUF4878)